MLNNIKHFVDTHPIGRVFGLGQEKMVWKKVHELKPGAKIAVNRDGKLDWDEIVSVKKVGRERVYDVEVEGTHNFVGNGIIAHNTYISGNLGIGVTSPSKTLDITGDIKLTGTMFVGAAGTTGTSGQVLSSNGAGSLQWISSGGVGTTYSATNGLTLGVGASNVFGLGGTLTQNTRLNIGNTEVLYLSYPDGNVGIGTTSPGSKLEINGGIRLTGNGSFSTNIAQIYRDATNGLVMAGYAGSKYDLAIADGAGTFLISNPQGTNNLSLIQAGGGSVGIGTTLPLYPLHVATTAADSISGNFAGYVAAQKYLDLDNQDKYFLDIANASDNSSSLALERSGSIRFNTNYIGSNWYTIQYGGATKIQNLYNAGTGNGGLLISASVVNAGATAVAVWDNSLFVSAKVGTTGFVGIGNTLPTERLDVTGSIKVSKSVIFTPQNTYTGTTLPGTVYFDTGSYAVGTSDSTGHLYVLGNEPSTPAWHRIAMDMTKYSVGATSIGNTGYIEIVHNQNTNDLLADAWVYDGTKYIQIDDFSGQPNINDPSLISRYKMEEASGTLDNSEGTAGNDLIDKNSPTYQQTGKNRYAVSFDGTNDYFCSSVDGSTCADVNALDVDTASFSIGGWFKHDTITTNPDYAITKFSTSPSLNSGNGADGAISVSTSKNVNTAVIRTGGTYADGIAYRVNAPADGASSVTRYLGSVTLSNGIAAGNEVMIINMQGAAGDYTDVGNYEIMTIQSVTADTITFTGSISKSYNGTTSSNQKVVVQRVPNYTTVTVASGGAITASAWDGLTTTPTGTAGYYTGIVAFRAQTSVTVNSGGVISVNGLGYQGGNANATQGTSRPGTGAGLVAANDGGGGAGCSSTDGTSGAGGGYGVAGTNGNTYGACGPAVGGGTYGNAQLTTLHLGSGGGGGNNGGDGTGGTGGPGGGIVFIVTPSVSLGAEITANGSNGGAASGGTSAHGASGGGGGSGGSIFIAGTTFSLGSEIVTTTAGAGGAGSLGAGGGAGGVGRIDLDYSGTSPGGTQTNPDATVTALQSSTGGYKLYMNSSGNYVFGISDTTSFAKDSATTETSYADNLWHHVVAVKNGTSSIRLYVDGQELASDYSLATTGSISNINPFYLGADYDGTSNTWAGLFDEVFAYNRAITAGEVQEIYRSNSRYEIQQTDANTVRLYNYSGETQQLRLDVVVFGADLAEWYTAADQSIEAGDVVSLTGQKDPNNVPIIDKSKISGDRKIMGIISTKAGQELGLPAPDRRLVALSGRVPVKIAPDSPSILAGDLLTASNSYPGMATKAITTGFTVAKSLDSWTPNTGVSKIDSFINVTWYDPEVFLTDAGQVYVSYNISESVLASLGYDGAKNEIESATYSLTDLSAGASAAAGSLVTKVGQFASLSAANLSVGLISAKNIIADNLVVKNIFTKQIKSDVILTGNLTATDATVSGLLTTNNFVAKEATISTLYADRIISREGNFSEILTDKITSLRDELRQIIADRQVESTPSAIYTASSTWDTSIATDSVLPFRSFSEGGLTLDGNLVIGADLTLKGTATLNSVSVSNLLAVGQMALKDNILETTASTLLIQPSGTGTISLLQNRLIIADTGEVTINGNLKVSGNLIASMLQAQKIEADLARFNKVEAAEATIGKINVTLDLPAIATDSASLVIAVGSSAPNSTSSASLISNATAGVASLPSGETEVVINNSRLTSTSMVYLTPNGSTQNQVVYVKSKYVPQSSEALAQETSFFTIGLDSTLPTDLSINWWIIN